MHDTSDQVSLAHSSRSCHLSYAYASLVDRGCHLINDAEDFHSIF